MKSVIIFDTNNPEYNEDDIKDIGKYALALIINEISALNLNTTLTEQGKNPKACSIPLRGASKDILNEMERNLQDTLNVARNLYQEPSLVPGGGTTEAYFHYDPSLLELSRLEAGVVEPALEDTVIKAKGERWLPSLPPEGEIRAAEGGARFQVKQSPNTFTCMDWNRLTPASHATRP